MTAALAETSQPQLWAEMPQVAPDAYDAAVRTALDTTLALLTHENRPTTGRVADLLAENPDLPSILSTLAAGVEPTYDNTPHNPDTTTSMLSWPKYAKHLRAPAARASEDAPIATEKTLGDWCYDVQLIDPAQAVLRAAEEKGISDLVAHEMGYTDAKAFALHVEQLRRVVKAETKRRIAYIENSDGREARQKAYAAIKEKAAYVPDRLLNAAKRLGNLVVDTALHPLEAGKSATRAVSRIPTKAEAWTSRAVNDFSAAWPTGIPPRI